MRSRRRCSRCGPSPTQRGGRLWCVFGCGGNRDTAKRPLMGAIAQRLADHVVLTSDNPRHESPGFILQQIVAGLVEQPDDRDGDRGPPPGDRPRGARGRRANDVILLAGKGHEDYQEIAGVQQPFSDVDEARFAAGGSGA